MRFWIIVAFLCLAIPSCLAHAGEPQPVVGTVVREFDGHSVDNVLGYTLESGTMSFDLILRGAAEEAWLKDHFGKIITVVGERGRRGRRDYLFVLDMTCSLKTQENQ